MASQPLAAGSRLLEIREYSRGEAETTDWDLMLKARLKILTKAKDNILF